MAGCLQSIRNCNIYIGIYASVQICLCQQDEGKCCHCIGSYWFSNGNGDEMKVTMVKILIEVIVIVMIWMEMTLGLVNMMLIMWVIVMVVMVIVLSDSYFQSCSPCWLSPFSILKVSTVVKEQWLGRR